MDLDIRKHVRAARILRVVAYVVVVSCLFLVFGGVTYDFVAASARKEMRALGGKIVDNGMTIKQVQSIVPSGKLEKVGENEYTTTRKIDHWMNYFDHEIFLHIKFRQGRAVEYNLTEFALNP